MKSPDGKVKVKCINYGEVRMGSPLFGRIVFSGCDFNVGSREFGEAMAYSPDSNFFAIAELVSSTTGPVCRVVVFDFSTKSEITWFPSKAVLIQSLEWVSSTSLKVTHWSHLQGTQTVECSIPTHKGHSSCWF